MVTVEQKKKRRKKKEPEKKTRQEVRPIEPTPGFIKVMKINYSRDYEYIFFPVVRPKIVIPDILVWILNCNHHQHI